MKGIKKTPFLVRVRGFAFIDKRILSWLLRNLKAHGGALHMIIEKGG